MLLKELLGRLARRPTGHDIPRDDDLLLAIRLLRQHLKFSDPLRLDLEQRLVTRQSDIKASLGRGAPETSPLPTSHQDDSDLVLGDELQTLIVPFLDISRIRIEDGRESYVRQWLEGDLGLLGLGRAEGGLGEVVDADGVEVGELVEETGLFDGFELIREGKDMALAGLGVFPL